MTGKPRAIETAATNGTLMVLVTNLPLCASIFIYVTSVVKNTGQWSALLQPQSLQKATDLYATIHISVCILEQN